MSIGTYVQHHVPHVPTHAGGRPIIAATLGLLAVVAIAVSVIVVRDDGGDSVVPRHSVTLPERADMMARFGVPYGGGVAGVEALRGEYYSNLERARILEQIGIPFGPVDALPAAVEPTSYNAGWKLDRLGDGGEAVYPSVAVSGGEGAAWKLDRLGDGGDAVYETANGGAMDASWIHEDTDLPYGLHPYP